MIIEVTQSSVLVGANNLDNTPDGTTYKRIASALATAINNETRLPTALGTADANAIAAATGATLAARLVGLAGPTIAGGRPAVAKALTVSVSKTAGAYDDIGISAENSTYLVHAWNTTAGGIKVALAGRNGNDYFCVELGSDSTNVAIAINGTSIRITNGTAETCTIYYAITQLSAAS